MCDHQLRDPIMQSQLEPAPAAISSESVYAIERRARTHIFDAEDALRAEKRRVSYATIDSNASKWRYLAVCAKG